MGTHCRRDLSRFTSRLRPPCTGYWLVSRRNRGVSGPSDQRWFACDCNHCALYLAQSEAFEGAHPRTSRLTHIRKETSYDKRRSIASHLSAAHSPLEDQPGDLAARARTE